MATGYCEIGTGNCGNLLQGLEAVLAAYSNYEWNLLRPHITASGIYALVMIGTFKNLRKQCCDIWQVTIYAYHIVKQNKKTCNLLKASNLHSSSVLEPTSYFLKYLLIHLGLELHFRFHNHC